jgi:hypothetical protein
MDVSGGSSHRAVLHLGNNPQYQLERVDWPQSQPAHDCEEELLCLS